MPAASELTDNSLIGTWKLVSYRLIGSRGRVRYPYGEDAVGYILYGPDAYMAVSIMSAGRLPFAGTDILRRTAEEAAEATFTYLSYSGRYELFSDRVLHHVEVSLFPNWTGTTKERFYRVDGSSDRAGRCLLQLSTAPLEQHDVARACLTWERVHVPQ
jgi:hypothetical protein